MKRLIAISISALVAAGPVSAGTLQDSIVSQLRQQGFTQIEINRTWLGRYRIIAKRRALRREIVINPATGTILRDYWTETPDEGARGLVDPDGPGDQGHSGGSQSDDNGDEGHDASEGDDSGEGDDGGSEGHDGSEGGDSGEGDDGGGGNSGSGGGDSDGGEGDD